MQNKQMIALVLLTLVAATAFSSWMSTGGTGEATTGLGFAWIGFLYILPLVLAGCVVTGHRWALMAGVMYGTIGLALDVSTVVQEITQDHAHVFVLVMSAVTGLLNFLLIVLGGRGFLTDQTLAS